MSDTKIQWHPGFVAAMNLELAENREDLVFEKEYNLNTMPLEIDLLVIKKEKNVHISNEIGRGKPGRTACLNILKITASRYRIHSAESIM